MPIEWVYLIAVLAAVAIGGALLLFARPKMRTRFIGSARRKGSGGSAKARKGKVQPVDATLYAPRSAPANAEFLIQLSLHKPGDAQKAQLRATRADPDAIARTSTPLDGGLAEGESVEIRIHGAGLTFEDPSRTVTWAGAPLLVPFVGQFAADAPPQTLVRVLVLVQGQPVGQAVCTLSKRDASSPSADQDDATPLTRFKRAFVSYASPDRVAVLQQVLLMNRLGLEVFQDILKLEPGERWKRSLYKHIDAADVFLLFWSTAASKSEWVVKESEYALARQDAGDKLAIIPVLLEGPPPPRPPPSLAELHFNDPIRYIIAAQQAVRSN